MKTFESEIEQVGDITFPEPAGTRIMMMPFHLHNLDTVDKNGLVSWKNALSELVKVSPVKTGTAYLTIDEGLVQKGNTQRRPGLHVDGVGPKGEYGGWGGGGNPWASRGMLVASSVFGCRAWKKEFFGFPNENGDCSHLEEQCMEEDEIKMLPNKIYFCSPLCVHESVPMTETIYRQFVRLSLPSDAAWYEGYTENLCGIKPVGPIHPPRPEKFMQGKK